MTPIPDIYKQYLPIVQGGTDAAAVLTLAHIQRECCKPHTGSMSLGHGDYELAISTPRQPTAVYLWITSDGMPVCQGNVNLAGAVITEGGFTLYATIRTNTATVYWRID